MFHAFIVTIILFAALWGIVGMIVCITLGNLLIGPNDGRRDHVSVFKTSVSTFAIALVLLYIFII